MEFLDLELQRYIEDHTQGEGHLLSQINRDTHLEVLKPRMLSGHLQGRVLSMLSHMIRPQNILEIGTYTGYSALSLTEGMLPNGTLVTLDINEELETRVRKYFEDSGQSSKIDFRIGNALDIIPTLKQEWDIVFIDADKDNYSNYYDLVIDQVKPGKFIIADNVLWSGKVLEKFRKKLDQDTEAILTFNKKVHDDPRVENALFPIRDGLMVLRKI